jgi:hypothetical protein
MSANGVEYISGCSLLLQRLHQLAGESGNLCFVISIRGTVKPHIFWRSVALALSRLATLRFCWFAACSGAPSQRWRVHADPQGELDRFAGPRVHRKLAEEFI